MSYATATFCALFAAATCWLIWRLSRPRRGPSSLRLRQLERESAESEPIRWRN